MSWKDRLIGPRWEHKDPEIRARAVAESNDPKLKRQLARLAVDDPDARVRLQALLRADLEVLWLRHALNDPDESIRHHAAERVPRLVLAADVADELSAIRLQWVRDSDDRAFLQRVASKSPLLELRRAALERIDSPGFLGDRVVHEPDDELARAALERIGQDSTLERIADELRRNSKQRYRWVLEKLAGSTAESGETGGKATVQRHLQIVRDMELLARGEYEGDRRESLDSLRAQWQDLPPSGDPSLERRFEGAARIVEAALIERHRPAPAPLETRIRALLEQSDRARVEQELQRLQAEAGDNPQHPVAEAIAAAQTHLAGLDIEPHDSLEKVARKIARSADEPPDKVTDDRIRELTAAWDRAWSGLDHPTAGDERLKNTVIGQLAGLREKAALARTARDKARAAASPAGAQEQLDAAEKALEAGELEPAHKALARARSETDRLPGKQAGQLRGRLNQLSGKLKEMRDWQHWSNNKIRRRLIREIEALPDAGLHADAISARLKEAREEWQALDRKELMPGDRRQFAAPPAEWRRFQAACRKAHETARPFFEKRHAIQQARLEEVTAFIEQAESAAADERVDYPEIRRLLNQARKSIRQVGDLPPDSRGSTANRLRGLMDQLDQRQEAHADAVEQRKQQLVREAQKLVHEQDHVQAMETAKALQAEWKKAGGSHRRKAEQALWKAFREPIDPLFEKARDQRKAREAERARQQEEWEALCAEAEKLAAVDDAQLEAAQGPMAGLAEQLGQEGSPAIRKRFARAEEKLSRRIRALEREQAEARLAGRAQRARLLQQAWALRQAGLESSEVESIRQAARENGDTEDQGRFAELLNRLLEADTDPAELDRITRENTEKARQLLVELEFLAGISSPEEDRQQRMDYQVRRLSAHLGGDQETTKDARAEAESLKRRWLEVHPMDANRFDTYEARFKKALEGLEEMLQKQ